MLVLQNTLHVLVFGAEHNGENIMAQECMPENVLMLHFD